MEETDKVCAKHSCEDSQQVRFGSGGNLRVEKGVNGDILQKINRYVLFLF
jgi:hypothetical protein